MLLVSMPLICRLTNSPPADHVWRFRLCRIRPAYRNRFWMRSIGRSELGPNPSRTAPNDTAGPTAFGSGASKERRRSKPAVKSVIVLADQARLQVRRAVWALVVVSGFWP